VKIIKRTVKTLLAVAVLIVVIITLFQNVSMVEFTSALASMFEFAKMMVGLIWQLVCLLAQHAWIIVLLLFSRPKNS
jgi:hypothetical protein